MTVNNNEVEMAIIWKPCDGFNNEQWHFLAHEKKLACCTGCKYLAFCEEFHWATNKKLAKKLYGGK